MKHTHTLILICMQVNIGEPHLPISVTQRGKASICPQFMIDDGHAAAGDHDFHCVNFTPSVNLVVDIEDPDIHGEDVSLQSYYKGMHDYFIFFLVIPSQ
jgi:hypothetical protein